MISAADSCGQVVGGNYDVVITSDNDANTTTATRTNAIMQNHQQPQSDHLMHQNKNPTNLKPNDINPTGHEELESNQLGENNGYSSNIKNPQHHHNSNQLPNNVLQQQQQLLPTSRHSSSPSASSSAGSAVPHFGRALTNYLERFEQLELELEQAIHAGLLANCGYANEFRLLKEFSKQLRQNKDNLREGELEINQLKNRYKDIIPFSHTRVSLLENQLIPGSDYINANYIRGASGSPQAYIACQGPLPGTLTDFWRMIWECRVSVLVMACNELESGKTKCEVYWPHEVDSRAVFGPFEIRLLRVRQICQDFLVRKFSIKLLKQQPTSLINNTKNSKPFQTSITDPLNDQSNAVHNLQRSFMTTANSASASSQSSSISSSASSSNLSSVNANCCHNCDNQSNIKTQNIQQNNRLKHYPQQVNTVNQQPDPHYDPNQRQFLIPSSEYLATQPVCYNVANNDNSYNNNRITITLPQTNTTTTSTFTTTATNKTPSPGQGVILKRNSKTTNLYLDTKMTNNNIDALTNNIGIATTSSHHKHIEVQSSHDKTTSTSQLQNRQNTASNNHLNIDSDKDGSSKVRMMHQNNPTMVSLYDDKQQPSLETNNLPQQESINNNNMTINNDHSNNNNSSHGPITNGNSNQFEEGETRIICQFHYTTWPDHGAPRSMQPILEMVRLMREVQPAEDRPILVHCSAGCGRTGTICCIDYVWGLLRRGELDPSFDLCSIISEMRQQRMAMVQTLEQYILCHRAVAALFIDQLKLIDDHTYENLDDLGPLDAVETSNRVEPSTTETRDHRMQSESDEEDLNNNNLDDDDDNSLIVSDDDNMGPVFI